MTANWWDDFAEMEDAGMDLSPLTTYRIGGVARHAFSPPTTQAVSSLLSRLNEVGMSWRVLGGGANVLIDDAEHDTPIILTRSLNRVAVEGCMHRVDAGVPFQRLVNETTRAGFSGLEPLTGIPGQMGGICAMNAGGRHGEVCDVVESVEFVTAEGVIQTLTPDDVAFRYRGTGLAEGIVTEVTMALEPGEPSQLVAKSAEILQSKRSTQPLTVPSGGCIFANPEGVAAGRLIEELGMKGRTVGGAQISEVHGNFIVNRGEARFSDVLELIQAIEDAAKEERGIALVREIKIWEAALGAT